MIDADLAFSEFISNPEALRAALMEPGRSQAGLARHMGLDTSAVNRLVNGGRNLKVREVEMVRGYLAATQAGENPPPVRREARGGGLRPGDVTPSYSVTAKPDGKVRLTVDMDIDHATAIQVLALLGGEK